MAFPLSAKTIQVLAEVISGGAANDGKEPIGIYRSGPKIERFMRNCNVDFQLTGSRLPSLEDCLVNLNRGPDAVQQLTAVIEAAAHPADFTNDPEKHGVVVGALNQALAYDGFELRSMSGLTRLCERGESAPVISGLSMTAGEINFDTVGRDLDRALENVNDDPEDAITSACSTVESVCRSILGCEPNSMCCVS